MSGNTVNVNRAGAFSDNHFSDANSWAQHDNWAGQVERLQRLLTCGDLAVWRLVAIWRMVVESRQRPRLGQHARRADSAVSTASADSTAAAGWVDSRRRRAALVSATVGRPMTVAG